MANEINNRCPWCKLQGGKLMKQKMEILPPEPLMTGMRSFKNINLDLTGHSW